MTSRSRPPDNSCVQRTVRPLCGRPPADAQVVMPQEEPSDEAKDHGNYHRR